MLVMALPLGPLLLFSLSKGQRLSKLPLSPSAQAKENQGRQAGRQFLSVKREHPYSRNSYTGPEQSVRIGDQKKVQYRSWKDGPQSCSLPCGTGYFPLCIRRPRVPITQGLDCKRKDSWTLPSVRDGHLGLSSLTPGPQLGSLGVWLAWQWPQIASGSAEIPWTLLFDSGTCRDVSGDFTWWGPGVGVEEDT